MLIQIVFVLCFAFNMVLIWFTGKFKWYRLPGLLAFVVMPFLTVFFAQPRFELDFFWWRMAGFAAIVVGTGVIMWARGIKIIPQEMITSGPYHFVRYPHYLGLVFVWVGWWWIWAAVYSFYFGMFILVLVWLEAYLEEKFVLEKLFGNKYREYRQQTGMFWIR